MKRGFPRERIEYGDKIYPIPYSSKDDMLVSSHQGRCSEGRYFAKCGMCGEQVKADELCMVAIQIGNASLIGAEWFCEMNKESGPFHLKCAVLVSVMCPHFGKSFEDIASSRDPENGSPFYSKSMYFVTTTYRDVRHLLVEL